MTKREILEYISKKVDFTFPRKIDSHLLEIRLRWYLGSELDAHRKIEHWSKRNLFRLSLLNLSKMIQTGEIIPELKEREK